MAATQINRIAISKEESLSDSNESASIPSKKKVRTGVYFKQQGKKTPKQDSAQSYCVLCKKGGMPEQNCIFHNNEDCFYKRFVHNYINDGLRVPMGIRSKAAKQYKRSEHKWKN